MKIYKKYETLIEGVAFLTALFNVGAFLFLISLAN